MSNQTRGEERTLDFLCECDDLACDERVPLTPVDYEWLVIEQPPLALASGHRLGGSAAGQERCSGHLG